MVNEGLTAIKPYAGVERALIAALLHDQIEDPILRAPLKEELENNSSYADVMMKINSRTTKVVVVEQAGCIFEERTEVEVQSQIDLIHFSMLLLSNSAAWNRARKHPSGPWTRSYWC